MNESKDSQTKVVSKAGEFEFIALMAALMSLAALATDAMLPALFDIGRDLQVAHENDTQLIISLIFIGMAAGQLLFGPLADTIGRKSSMLLGAVIFLAGSLITVFAGSFFWMLIGRLIQGIGLGAPRTVSVAIVRDQYVGRQMAKIMSNIMSVFMIVPMVAPMTGQLVLLLGGDWRTIFAFIFVFGAAITVWFALRQPETLLPENRVSFSFAKFARAIGNVCREPVVMLYAVATGFIFAGFIGYLSASSQVFQKIYPTGPWFVFIFAMVALVLAIASQLNSRWVVRLGMQKISYAAMTMIISLSLLFVAYMLLVDPLPPLPAVIVYLALIMFAQGGLFGNINALAMEPLDRGAGIGAMVIGIVSTLISVPLGVVVARQVEHSFLPLALGFLVFCSLTMLLTLFIELKIKQGQSD